MIRALHRRLSPLILLFACLQALVPGLAAVADAWRVDKREPYAHVESETHSACVLVHGHDCMLCAVATSTSGEVRPTSPVPSALLRQSAPSVAAISAISRHDSRAASQRAPPEGRG
ncbi:MAG: hypothetical protein V4617_14015 [Gemmatimonadota bacterium]